ncbi:N-acetyl-gamma-glutamyl-phosphate reductase [Bacillus cytotoxicus]|uniref:N-acetyl-gamma-glutamyl-phosphate reductase n=1 Tax=Bacillus cytotoxicus (strain DSM 22905 / CIP 110041 / 391-98 / NVH 391-98) TaxID=315749 RepID=ARGC_BACCN|nr:MULTISPECIES: N-acetyl-gamma-glutamyl-phosphate reductase [Bacillus cereus group]A7GSF4.1 RecName: Full=N-acetyl-gamma-glutamyl-phosphate reductase; Short=AGPR; AltName: Full=N-acetyl-glutamate semialdehyde dehydrogenase; Short=NAGSA dehydrogenase [Bacillus cytotoxicus NVH 391-98]ABS23062.1 N-acetyl-gamma-glutamyl-phosphate reductase [Bacillus cytotoxicus NVH 391-98]AWC33718.1 N-acetyl-gamma-glutamyl-phosphate reductase [Bacillus cytotoxicus]AWC37697.1 N-acetyl-gamma-glutamyl-phosphate reduc
MKVAIIGATGYGGIELIRLLQQHPYFSIVSIHSFSQVGEHITSSYPHLRRFLVYTLQEIDVESIKKEADLVFLATPAGVSVKLTPLLLKAGLKVIDLSGDFRMVNPSIYEMWYKKPAASEEFLQQAVYGLSEWKRDEIQQAKLVANPGCFATATLLAIAPLMRNKIIEENSIIIDAKSGVSGAGKTPTHAAHFPELYDNLHIYKVNEHQHIPEIEQMLIGWNEQAKPITFSTHLIPVSRGIMVTLYAKIRKYVQIEELHNLYTNIYKNAYFVRIRPYGEFPSIKEVRGSNYCDIGIGYDERTKRITVVAVIDNMMKGAAGQAVQNANLVARLDEKTGLQYIPIYP